MGLLSLADKLATKAIGHVVADAVVYNAAPKAIDAAERKLDDSHERFRRERQRDREAGRQKQSILLYKMEPGEHVINVDEHVMFEDGEAQLALTNRTLILRRDIWAFGWRESDTSLPLLSFATCGKEPDMELGSGKRHGTTITITVMTTESVAHNDGIFDSPESLYYTEEEREVKKRIVFDSREKAEHWLVWIYDAFMYEKYGTLEPGFFDRGKRMVYAR